MRTPKPDKNGCFVFDSSPLKRVPLITLVVFAVIIIAFSAYYLIVGMTADVPVSVVRIVSCAAILAVSVFMLIRRDRYIVTDEKVLLYGKWEVMFSDITAVSLHDNLFGFVEITSENGVFTVPALEISCPLKIFAEILSERVRIAQKRHHRK